MTHQNHTFIYSIIIILGMFGIVASDTLLSGQTAVIAIVLNSGVILASLIGKMIANHAVLMESDAPGALLYQQLVTHVQLPVFRPIKH